MSWRNPFEKRQFVNPKTGKAAEKVVQGREGEVIGMAKTPDEEIELINKSEQAWKEAA
jgi:hypothetical protein